MAQVHDSILFQVPLSLGATSISKGVLQIREYLTPTILLSGQEFIIYTDLKGSFKDWNSMEEIDINADVYDIEENIRKFIEREQTTDRLDNSVP